MLRDGPLFFFGAGEGFGQFPKKVPAQQKQLKKILARRATEKKTI